MSLFDLAVIGGGVNGCGIARDAAGRGLSVFLCEKGDLAAGASSASTKLIHGGLRDLETFEFGKVREALAEREVLMRLAPHIVRPMRFVMPHRPGLRAWPILRLGAYLYDRLAGRRVLETSRSIDLRNDPAGSPLAAPNVRALEYSDCRVDDSRLVVLNAIDAAERGASIVPRTCCVGARRENGVWRVRCAGSLTGEIGARSLVNAAGPWVDEVARGVIRVNETPDVRLARASHIVTRSLFPHDRGYLLQQPDGRAVFVIPYEDDFTLIGATDVDHEGAADDVAASEEEIRYLCEAASAAFSAPVYAEDVVWAFAGVRPIHDVGSGSGSARDATRDFALALDADGGRAPLLTVYGGEIGVYRKLAEAALEKLGEAIEIPSGRWTSRSPLPGGGVHGDRPLEERLVAAFPYLAPAHAVRLARAYGSRAWDILDGTRSSEDLGRVFGADLTERETRYLIAKEWARTAEDVLWRRSKLGLRFTEEQWNALAAFMPDGGA